MTQERDGDVLWVDNTHILFNRGTNDEGVWATYIINLETLELETSEDSPPDRYGVNIFSDSNGAVRIFHWQLEAGGTNDLYVTDVNNRLNIGARFTVDGSACYEVAPRFRP